MLNKYLLEAQHLLRRGQFGAAAELCRKSLKLQKDMAAARVLLADCHYNFGVYHHQFTGLLDAAEAEFRRALEVDPRHAEAASNLGSLLLTRGRGEEALAHFRGALNAKPGEAPFLANLARALAQVDQLDEASATLVALAERDQANAGAYLLCDAMLTSDITPDEGYPQRIRERIRAKLQALESRDLPLPDPLVLPTTYFPLSYHGVGNVEIVKRLAALLLRWNPALGAPAPHVRSWRRPRGRARIGIASRFLRDHSIGNTSRGLVEQLDRDRFEVAVLRLEPSSGVAMARAIDAAADRVVTVPPDLAAARETVARLELDILFYQDIGMEPLSYHLALARLAPVQLTSFGHPDTTGIPNLDFFLSSELYEPSGAQDHYSERLVKLPGAGTLSYYHAPPAVDPVPSREAFGIARDERLYLCPQALFKLQPVMDGVFAKIAERDPGARIVLIESIHRAQRPAIERRLRAQSAALAERVRFVPSLPFEKYLGLVAAADVVLDTVHFNGQNTTLEALALGVPVVTWPQAFQRGRHGLGMYRAMGFMDLVAESEDDYAQIAVRAATDAAFRAHCVQHIAQARGVLYENRAFIRGCEDALEEMMLTREREPG